MSEKSYKYVIVEKQDHVAVITMNRPERLNALGGELGADMHRAVEDVDGDPEIRAVITTGAGRSFSSRADLKETGTHSSESVTDSMSIMSSWGQWAMFDIQKPSIAAINGLCVGGGLEHALGCDIMMCSENATFLLPQTNLGIFPGLACPHLVRRVGKSWAMEMVLAGEWMDAKEALHIGLVNRVVPPEELMPAALKLAKSIAAKAPLGILLGKQTIERSLELPLRDAIQECGPLLFPLYGSEDRKEASRAFLEKREAKFVGR